MVGLLIAVEGIDSSGKGTQSEILREHLESNGHTVKIYSFPRYDTPLGGIVASYLRGEFGQRETIPPEAVALFYALDRYQFAEEIGEHLGNGEVVICDRYTESNLAYQGARIEKEGKNEFAAWVKGVESRMPTADVVIFLDLPVEEAKKLRSTRSAKDYLKGEAEDIHESDRGFLNDVAQMYEMLARSQKRWHVVNCFQDGSLRGPQEIGRDIASIVDRILSNMI